MISINCKLPKHIDVMDLDKKIIKAGLRQASRIVQQTSKRLITSKRRSKPGEYPGRDTGLMRRNVKVVMSKRPTRLWSRVEVSTLKDSFFYPAVLAAGSEKRNILPRRNFIGDALEQTKDQTSRIIENALVKSLKVWGK